MTPGSFQGTRTSGTVAVDEMPCSMWTISEYSIKPCCMSMQTQSNPQWAMISADTLLGRVNHPPRAAPC